MRSQAVNQIYPFFNVHLVEQNNMENMAKNNSKEINFQHYIDGVKTKKIPWNFFIDVMEDLTYANIGRLRNLNAILLMELTVNFSDIDRMKYLNEILLIQFKDDILTKHELEITENDNIEKSNVVQIVNDKTYEDTSEEILIDEK